MITLWDRYVGRMTPLQFAGWLVVNEMDLGCYCDWISEMIDSRSSSHALHALLKKRIGDYVPSGAQ